MQNQKELVIMPNSNTSPLFGSNFLLNILIVLVLLGSPLFLFIDSPRSPYYSNGQDISNLVMLLFYSSFLFLASRKLYWLILLMTLSGILGEIVGSLMMELYKYRFHNIPMYIPMGHAVIYACMYQLSKQPWIWRYHHAIERCLGKFAFVTSFLSLFILRDVGGFICYIIFLGILRYRKKPLFYLLMFAMVYYTELLGTVFSTWSWYSVLGNHPDYVPIGYTPSGMAGLYILIDLVSNSIYFYALKISKYLSHLGLSSKIQAIKSELVIQPMYE